MTTETTEKQSKVRAIRDALELTQQQMADEMGCHKDSLRRFEYDGTLPKQAAVLKNLRRLAKKAGIELDGAGG